MNSHAYLVTSDGWTTEGETSMGQDGNDATTQGRVDATGILATGKTNIGGWVTYDTAEAAFADIGFGFDFPDEAYGRVPRSFSAVTEHGRRYLSVEYWNAPREDEGLRHMSIVPLVVACKELDGMPAGTRTDTNQNRHNIEMSGHVVTVCSGATVTVARWKFTDPDSGLTWHYYVSVGMPVSDESLLGLIRQFDEDLVWNRPKSVM